MKIDLNFSFKGLDGNPTQNKETAGQILAATLANMNKGNSIKLIDWAIKLYNGNPIELDATDTDVLVGIIETSESFTNLGKAQILEVINKAKAKVKP